MRIWAIIELLNKILDAAKYVIDTWQQYSKQQRRRRLEIAISKAKDEKKLKKLQDELGKLL